MHHVSAAALLLLALPLTSLAAQQDGLAAHSPVRLTSLAPRSGADTTDSTAALDSLIRHALSANPALRAADSRVRAAAAQVPQAGARPDPMLMVGLTNFPIGHPGFSDFMTMKTVGVRQTFPYPGKLGRMTEAARQELEAVRARASATRLDVVRQVREMYYDLVQADQLYEVVIRNQRLLVGLMQATEASYRVGRSGQEDVLRARVEGTRLSDEAAALVEGRRAALARLNALLDRPSETPVASPHFPAPILRAAVADTAKRIHFTSARPGARVSDSPLPALDSLQSLALAHSPVLAERDAEQAAQTARVELARKATLPDVDVSLQYGQRTGFTDMVSATISIPLAIQAGRKQRQAVLQSEADLAAVEAESRSAANTVRARVAELAATLERDRTQLALYTTAILPEARGALEAATAGFQVGRTDFQALLDRQATLYNYEMDFTRALTDFAKSLAALDQTIGQEALK